MCGELRRLRRGRPERRFVERVEILANSARGLRGINDCGVPVLGFAGALLLDIRADQAGIDGEPGFADRGLGNARRDDVLEQAAEQVALTGPAVAQLRKGRVIGDLVFETEATEPSIRQVKMDLLVQRRSDLIPIT